MSFSSEDMQALLPIEKKSITGDYNDLFDFAREGVLPLLEPTRQLLVKLDRLITQF